MKEHLIEIFKYNDWANRKLLGVIKQLPENQEPAKLFSHLITSQNKWFNRIRPTQDDSSLNWFGPEFPIEQLEDRWTESVSNWLDLLDSIEEKDLEESIVFERPSDGQKLSVKVKEIMTQLNFHSVHHRAQINTIIRKQGLTPPPTDYIFTVLKEA